MGKGAWDDSVCRESMQAYPVDSWVPGAPDDMGGLMVLCGPERGHEPAHHSLDQDEGTRSAGGWEAAVKSVIFPVFVKVLWASVFS